MYSIIKAIGEKKNLLYYKRLPNPNKTTFLRIKAYFLTDFLKFHCLFSNSGASY